MCAVNAQAVAPRFPTTYWTQELLFSFLHTLAFLETAFADRCQAWFSYTQKSMIISTARTCRIAGRRPTHVPFFGTQRLIPAYPRLPPQHVCRPLSAWLCDPADCSPPDPAVHGVLNAKWCRVWVKWTKWLCVSPEWQQVPFLVIHQVLRLVAQSRPTLGDPMDGSLPGSSVYGVLQARRLERVAISFSNIDHVVSLNYLFNGRNYLDVALVNSLL